MQNGNQKTKVENQVAALIRNYKPLDGKHADPQDVAEAMKAFKNLNEIRENAVAGCFFLKADELDLLVNIPKFQGISIYIGKIPKDNKEEEVLILLPVTKGSLEPVYTLAYSHDGGPTQEISTVVALPPGPCPPNPAGCNYCCPR